jgi:hypothetical protein
MATPKEKPISAKEKAEVRRRLANKYFTGKTGDPNKKEVANIIKEGRDPKSKMVGREPMLRRMREAREADGYDEDKGNRRSEVIEALKGAGELDEKGRKKKSK